MKKQEAASKAPHVVTPEKNADLDASRAQAAGGVFATDEETRAVWAEQVGKCPLDTSDVPAVGESEKFQVKGAQVPFMITQSQKQALRKMGFDDDQISNMTPAQAHRLLGVK